MKKTCFLILTIFFLMFIFAIPAFAADNIKIINSEASSQELIFTKDSKMLLDKEWYNYEFEINPITSQGSLQMQAVDSVGYMKALQQVNFPLEAVGEYKVYFLSYKLKNYYSAEALSFEDNSVVVFGTYFPLSVERLHRLAIHELGHQVDFSLMDEEKWQEYKKIRGITNKDIYNNSSSEYVNRPQEIFAEDFRLLFGSQEAQKKPHLNKNLPDPRKVAGLKDFFLSLVK